jgi:hypothetical protein
MARAPEQIWVASLWTPTVGNVAEQSEGRHLESRGGTTTRGQGGALVAQSGPAEMARGSAVLGCEGTHAQEAVRHGVARPLRDDLVQRLDGLTGRPRSAPGYARLGSRGQNADAPRQHEGDELVP